MADSSSSTSSGPGLGDLLGLLGGSNPLSGISKTIAQFQKGVSQFLESVEKFNDTMDQLNGVATRLNGMLDTVEAPVKAFVPQLTRTIRAADSLVEQLSGPVEKIGPTLTRFAETLSSPVLMSLAALRGGNLRPQPEPVAADPTPAAPKSTTNKKAPVKKAAPRKVPGKPAPVKKVATKNPAR
ncbi:MAG: hypothetical protein WCI22_13330 [Actinomycetota bacterium]